MHSFLCSVAGSSASFSSSPNFPKCSSPRESASVFTDYLRSHFSVSWPKTCVAEPESAYLSSAEPRALKSLIRPFALPSPQQIFLRLPPTSPRPLPLAQTKLPISCESIFLALAWIFFFTFSIVPGLCIPFPPSVRCLPLFPSTN